jgi:hypothetical protein
MKFAMTESRKDYVAAVECNGVLWPFACRQHAKEMAREVETFGVWQLKPKKESEAA